MALSQIQCLDDNHVNPRTHEAKPEFFYCENQRLALEALLRGGPEAFAKCLKARGLRGFLSDAELGWLAGAAERYDPGAEPVYPEPGGLGGDGGGGEDGGEPEPLSSHYWPELSDTSVPQLELGWPDCAAYRGVTRANVYAQPPLEGNGHLKEIVRKAIAQAQKVIAVVMDMFTDVDIFRDLLDAGFKKKVSVYILLERTAIPHFLSMCRRADMHVGHLKNLRVRSTGGVEFHTRCSTKVSGRLGHRFMFVDGDKALSGSYNFTWMSSRLEKHMLNVITGQAVDAFDRLFRELYSTSSAVDLRPVATDAAPEPEPLQTVAPEKPPSAALARKLYNPKYEALVAAGCNSSSPASSNSPKDSQNAAIKKGRNKGNAKAAVEAPPLHPGLSHLEKAYLIPYLPTWPEPDPPSDVIGFINIIDTSRPTQVHLQRHEMFGTSQAIRFSSPFSAPEQSLKPETLLQPRQFSKYKDKVEEDADADKKETPRLDGGPSKPDPKAPPDEQVAEVKLAPAHAKTDALEKMVDAAGAAPLGNSTSTSLNSGCKMLAELTHAVGTTSSAKVEPLPAFAAAGHAKPVPSTHAPEYYNPAPQTSDSSHGHVRPPVLLQTEVASKSCKHAETVAGREDSGVQPLRPHPSPIASPLVATAVPTPPITTATSSAVSASVSTSSTSAVVTAPASTPSVSSLSTSSPPLHAAPLPVPKPRTVQLVIRDGAGGAGVAVSEVSVVKRAGAGSITAPGPPPVPAAQAQPGADVVVRHSEKETAPVLTQARIKTGAQTETGNVSLKPKEECHVAQLTGAVSNERMHRISNAVTGVQSHREGTQGTPRETKTHQAQPHISSSDKSQKENAAVKGTRRTECETAILTNVRVAAKPQAAFVASSRTPPTKSSEAPNEDAGNVTRPNTEPSTTAKELLRTDNGKGSFAENGLQPQNKGLPDVVNSVHHKAGTTHNSFPAHNHVQRHHPDVGAHSQVTKQNVDGVVQPTAADAPDNGTSHASARSPPPREHGAVQNSQDQPGVKGGSRRPEKDMCLQFPDTPVRAAELHSPASDWLPPRTPTPDSRTQTPDFRILTPTSDGYVSPRGDSTLSTTSEEYYDCSDLSEFPSRDPVFDLSTTPVNSTATTAIATATSTPISTNTTTNMSPIPTITAISTAAATAPTTHVNSYTHINSAPTTTRSTTTTTPIRPTNTATTTTTHPPVTATATAPVTTTTTRTTTVSRYVSSTSTGIDSSARLITRRSSTDTPSVFNDTHAYVSTRAEPPLAASIVLSLCYTPPPAGSHLSDTTLAVPFTATITPIITTSSPTPRTPATRVMVLPAAAWEPEERPMSPTSLRWRIEEEQTEREGPVCEILTPLQTQGLGLVPGLRAGENASAHAGSFAGTKKRLRESSARSLGSVDLSAPGLRTDGSSRDGFRREEEESHAVEDMRQTDLSSGRERALVRQSAGSERAAQTPSPGPGGVDKRDRPPSAKETEGKKLLRLAYGLPSQTRTTTPQPSRPASRPPNPQTAKALHHHGSPQTPSPPQAPRRPPPRKASQQTPVGVVAGGPAGAGGGGTGGGAGSRRQAEEPPHHMQPTAAAQGKTRSGVGQAQNQPPYPKPQASFLHSHSNLQSKVPLPQQQQSQQVPLPSPQNQTASQAAPQRPGSKQGSEAGSVSDLSTAGEDQQGKASFGFAIGKLYSLKGLKDKMGKTLPPASASTSSSKSLSSSSKKKRGSNPPAQGHKGTG